MKFEPGLLPYDDAFRLTAELGAVLLPMFGAALEGPIGAAMDGRMAVEDVLASDVAWLLGQLDRPALIEAARAALLDGRLGPAFVRRALATSTLDGNSLATPVDFEAAYRGRVLASVAHTFETLRVNGVFSWSSTSAPPVVGEGS